MKKALKFKSNYIIGSILAIIGIGLPFLIWGIRYNSTGLKDFPYHMVMLIISLAYFILGIIISDIPLIIFKTKTSEINPEIPEEVTLAIWRCRWPAFIGSIATLLSISIIGIIYLITGAWPLM